MMDTPWYGHSTYTDVFGHLKASIHAEQVFCSIVTEMTFMPEFKDLAGLETVHRENYETSYHRNTAAGNLHRLLAGETNEMLVLMTVECFIEARRHDKTAEKGLEEIASKDAGDASWVNAAKLWHERRKRSLKMVSRSLQTIIGPELWKKGAALAE